MLHNTKLVKDKEKLKNGPRLKESKSSQTLNAIKIITRTLGEIQIKDIDELIYGVGVNFPSLKTVLVLVKNSCFREIHTEVFRGRGHIFSMGGGGWQSKRANIFKC